MYPCKSMNNDKNISMHFVGNSGTAAGIFTFIKDSTFVCDIMPEIYLGLSESSATMLEASLWLSETPATISETYFKVSGTSETTFEAYFELSEIPATTFETYFRVSENSATMLEASVEVSGIIVPKQKMMLA